MAISLQKTKILFCSAVLCFSILLKQVESTNDGSTFTLAFNGFDMYELLDYGCWCRFHPGMKRHGEPRDEVDKLCQNYVRNVNCLIYDSFVDTMDEAHTLSYEMINIMFLNERDEVISACEAANDFPVPNKQTLINICVLQATFVFDLMEMFVYGDGVNNRYKATEPNNFVFEDHCFATGIPVVGGGLIPNSGSQASSVVIPSNPGQTLNNQPSNTNGNTGSAPENPNTDSNNSNGQNSSSPLIQNQGNNNIPNQNGAINGGSKLEPATTLIIEPENTNSVAQLVPSSIVQNPQPLPEVEQYSCCGRYPSRYPYRVTPDRGCCNLKTYSTLHYNCCNSKLQGINSC